MITEPTATKIVHHLIAMVAGFALCMAIALLWDWGFVPRKVLSTGTVTTAEGRVLETRKFRPAAKVRYQVGLPHIPVHQIEFEEEVQLPSGRWIDCAGDCAEAARRALN